MALFAHGMVVFPNFACCLTAYDVFRHPISAGPTEQPNNITNKSPAADQVVRLPERPMAIFPKGKDAERELTDSAEKWMMQLEVLPSRSDPQGRIIRLKGLARKER